jgi:hypothetical protein
MNHAKPILRQAAVVPAICAVFLLFLFFLMTACGSKYAPMAEVAVSQNASMKAAAGSGAQYSRVSMEASFADSALDVEAYGRRDGEAAFESPASLEAPQTDGGGGDGAGYGANPGEAERKLVKTASLRIRTEDPAQAEKSLNLLMETYRAWSASTTVYENSRNYTLRMPQASYEVFLADLQGLGRLLSKTENAEDVTLQYYDLEGRLATKQELLKTFQGYLSKAKDIEEIMTVERRIAELQQEIDWTGTQLRNLAHLVDYSTIELELLGPVAAVNYSGPSLFERFGELFGGFGEVVSGGLVVVTGIVIYGVPALLLAVLLFWLLFGRVGLIKKLWRLAAGAKQGGDR